MAYFEATDSFDEALAEVEHLLECAESSHAIRRNYLTYLKAAIALLGAKFEAFAENVVQDYVDALCALNPKAKHLPHEFRIASTKHLLNQCINESGFSGKTNSISSLQAAASLWNEDVAHSNLTVSIKFNYGKHGSNEVRSLFQRVGIADILTDCQVSNPAASPMLGHNLQKISILPDIDSFTNIRNNIIHSDSTPNFTHQQIHGYKEKFWEFGYMVDQRLERELNAIKIVITTNP